MDPELCLDPELGKFKAGSGSGINHSGSATLASMRLNVFMVDVFGMYFGG